MSAKDRQDRLIARTSRRVRRRWGALIGTFDEPTQRCPIEPTDPGARTKSQRGLTPDGRLKSGRLAGLSMRRAIWVLSWPIMIESFLNSLVGLTDTVLATGLADGEAATDAIGGASYIMWFIGLIAMALGVGATALISRAVGGGRLAVANAALAQTLLLALVLGGLTGAVVVSLSRPVAGLLNMTPSATDAFASYMQWIGLGVPFTSLLFAGIACARGAGDSVRPLYAMVAVNIVNIVVSWALAGVDLTRTGADGARVVLLENPFTFDLGVQGIALGTVCAHVIGSVIIIAMAIRGTWGIRLLRHRLVPHWHTIRRLVRVGLPNFVETFGLWIGNFLVLLMVGWLGAGSSGVLGSHIVAIRIEAFSFLPGFAMGAAAATLAGQYLGAGSAAHARRAVISCVMIAAVVMGMFGSAFVLFPKQIVGLLSAQPAHMEMAPRLVFICGVVQIPFAIAIVTRGALRGAGDVKVVMTLTWIATYAIRLPLAYFLSGVDIPVPVGWQETLGFSVIPNPSGLEPSLAGLWLGLCLELIVRCAMFVTRFAQPGWTRARV